MFKGKLWATSFRKNRFFGAALWLFVFLLVGCGGGELTYQVSGSGSADITWADSDGVETIETVTLPWETTIEAPSNGTYRVEALRTDEGQGVSCEVLFDGEKIGESGDALRFAGCSGSYEISGGDRSINNQSSQDVLPNGKSALPAVGLDALTDIDTDWQTRFDRLEFDTYRHNSDCTASDIDLIIQSFEIDYLADSIISDCTTEGVSNYANITVGFEGYGDIFIVLGYNNHTRETSEYVEYAESEFPTVYENFVALFDSAEVRNAPEYAVDTVTADFDILSNTQSGFLRFATIPNFDTGEGLNLVFVAPAFSDNAEDEFDLFNAYTSQMVNSVKFLDEPKPDPAAALLENLGNWEDRYNRIAFSPYAQSIDCTPYSALLPLREIFMDIPDGMNVVTCEDNPDAYAAFTADLSMFDVPEMRYIVGRVEHPNEVEDYVAFAREAIPGFAETDIIAPYNGTLKDDSNLEIGEFLFIRYDYDIVRDGNPGFARLVLYPNLETGQGIFFIFLSPTITEDLEDEYLLFDATTKRTIESTRFSLAADAESTSSDGGILASIDPGMDVGHLVAFDDMVDASGIDSFMFLGTEGDRVFINASADQSLALALRDLSNEEVVATDSGTDARIEYTLPANGLYQIGIINSSDSEQNYVATFEGDVGVSFELQPHFYAIGSYAPEQRLSYLILDPVEGDDLVFQAQPHPIFDLDLEVEIYAFSDSQLLLSQDNQGKSQPEVVYYTVGQDGLNPPYVVWVEGVDGEGGIFMLTLNHNGVGNLNLP